MTNFNSLYDDVTPRSYIEELAPTNYGEYHTRFSELATEEVAKFRQVSMSSPMRAVDMGSAYGNTTLAWRCGYDWKATSEVWLNDSKPLKMSVDCHVTGVDCSAVAVDYGKKRGIFEDIIVHDFRHSVPAELGQVIEEADFMTFIMAIYFCPTEKFLEKCFKFLSDRSKPKLLAYNVAMAFDTRNLSPEVIFASVPGWKVRSSFNKHRNLTELEQATRHGCTEAWTMTYFVHFDAIPKPGGSLRQFHGLVPPIPWTRASHSMDSCLPLRRTPRASHSMDSFRPPWRPRDEERYTNLKGGNGLAHNEDQHSAIGPG
eukprot:CAMPEP_0181317644 /NCGR_PEP_ID=MMETSP1101-20121128/16582_1 /TAXON_ID=46948 /ORGANISM="Rhodomonas abbreviata, Strain Caron Lab Isolate" /LENGTH=314 /DNA_ID=CAMNT_0023425059 /DNA_START=205 /DNA_END=1148 /DNA_ORIENTATION=-